MRQQRPYRTIICYTFPIYKQRYPEFLKLYRREYSHNLESDTDLFFWTEQKKLYEECLLNVTLEQKEPRGMENNIFDFYPKSLSIGVLQQYLDSDKEYKSQVYNENGIHGEYGSIQLERKSRYDNLFRIFTKILRFIDERISELNSSDEELNNSNTQKTSIEKKTLALHRMGVIDFLLKNVKGVNSQQDIAEILQKIIGGTASNIQRVISDLQNNNVSQSATDYVDKLLKLKK